MSDIKDLKIGAGRNLPTAPVKIDTIEFPDQPPRGEGVPSTIDNVQYMLTQNGVTVRYNCVKKRTEVDVPWLKGGTENADSVSMTHVSSLAARYGMSTGLVPAMVDAIGEANSYNPAGDWIRGKPWDGTDRLQAICDTITPREGYPLPLRDLLIRKWLLSAVAAAVLTTEFRCRGVLTLQGSQGLGKTSWGLSLIDDPALRSQLLKVDHHLDASNKDSVLGAVCNWIVEIGELDSSFRRDIARLKGFITSGTDKVRRPYARAASEYRRCTVFYATVNDSGFLVDDTGNTRWWTIACEKIDFNHGIDMQQVFAECSSLLDNGEVWWLTPEEERQLEQQNARHRTFSVVRDRLTGIVDTEVVDLDECRRLTPTELLNLAGIERPTNGQAKECAGLLREWFGDSKRINGRDKWPVPLRSSVSEYAMPKEETRYVRPASKFD